MQPDDKNRKLKLNKTTLRILKGDEVHAGMMAVDTEKMCQPDPSEASCIAQSCVLASCCSWPYCSKW